MSRAQKRVAVMLGVCLVAVSVFAAIAIASHADHECGGEHCKSCLGIARLQDALKQFGAAVSVMAFTLAAPYVFAAVVKANGANKAGTLVSLKVQLNN